ncbi:MAG: hypothetical protein WCI11_04605 [Candidatus Methylumidiphilus sp.]
MNAFKKLIISAGFVLGILFLLSGNVAGQQDSQASVVSNIKSEEPLTDHQRVEIQKIIRESISDSGVLRDKIEEKFKAGLDEISHKDTFYITILWSLIGGGIAINWFTVKNRVDNELKSTRNETDKELKTFKNQLHGFGKKIEETIQKSEGDLTKYKQTMDDKLKALEQGATEEFQCIIALQQMQYRLFNYFDLNEPSLRHPLTESAEKFINAYLHKVEELKGKIIDLKLTFIDFEREGDARHYLANSIKKDVERCKIEEEAIQCYFNALNKPPGDEKFEELNFSKVNTSTWINVIKNRKIDEWSHDILRKVANACCGAGIYEEAIKIYKKLNDYTESDARVWLSLGDAYKGQGDYSEALGCYNNVESLMKSNTKPRSIYWEALYQSGNIHSGRGHYDDAIKYYKPISDAIKEEPSRSKDFPWVNHSLGDAYRKHGIPEDSLKYYQAEIDLVCLDEGQDDKNKRLGETHYKLGRSHTDMKEYENAISDYENAETYNFTLPIYYAFYGYALSKSKEPDKQKKAQEKLDLARSNAKSEFEADETNFENKYSLAVCYAFHKDVKQNALDHLPDIFEKKPFMKAWAKAANYSDFVTIKDEVKALVEPS